MFASDNLHLNSPGWRPAQLGALGALLGHWSLLPRQPALVSLPTGSGKSGVALAAPFLANAKRTLVVVPSAELRKQIGEQFENLKLLKRIGAVSPESAVPRVKRVEGLVQDWATLEEYDVVVGIPNSISPSHYKDILVGPPPSDLFDLVIMDEAHHSPADTWAAILDHFSSARALLLTATPVRHDRKRVPGERIYYYPLSLALANGIYKPIVPILLKLPANPTKQLCDELIAHEVKRLLSQELHHTSGCLVRCANLKRAEQLKDLYSSIGVDAKILESKLSSEEQRAIIEGLKTGLARVVIIVGMLIEGFDSSNLRILAYHDKHRSVPITVQLLGRLARADDDFPQPSHLITVQDAEVYPELQTSLKELYEQEDRAWSEVVPGLLDGIVVEDKAETKYNSDLASEIRGDERVSSYQINPRCSITIKEVPDAGWEPQLEDLFTLGQEFLKSRATVVWTVVTPSGTTLVVVTKKPNRPRWYTGAALDSTSYSLSLFTFARSQNTDQPSLLLINAEDKAAAAIAMERWTAQTSIVPADPGRLAEMFDSNERVSLSGLGLRTLGGVEGVAGYATQSGRDFERGVRPADSDHRALGHVMATIKRPGGKATNGGIAAEKGKYWEFSSISLRRYEKFINTVAGFYWFPVPSVTGPLLPQVSRASRLTEWPKSKLISVEYDPFILGRDYCIELNGEPSPLDQMEVAVTLQDTAAHLEIVVPETGEVVWEALQTLDGNVTAIDDDLDVFRGMSPETTLSELLSLRPLVFRFLDRSQVVGAVLYSPQVGSTFPEEMLKPHDWSGADLTREGPTGKFGDDEDKSIHQALFQYLRSQPRRGGKHRWIVYNDGTYELADFIVIEIDSNRKIHLTLWHAKKPGGANPSIRVGDFEEVVSQAVKSRRWITDGKFWERLGNRLAEEETPWATVVEGNAQLLKVLCGVIRPKSSINLALRRPQLTGHLGICQPGLDIDKFKVQLALPIIAQAAFKQIENSAFQSKRCT